MHIKIDTTSPVVLSSNLFQELRLMLKPENLVYMKVIAEQPKKKVLKLVYFWVK